MQRFGARYSYRDILNKCFALDWSLYLILDLV
jgi:hypothetical protein